MRAITQSSFGGPEVLEAVDVDVPQPDHGQVLVALGAAGVNPVDAAVRRARTRCLVSRRSPSAGTSPVWSIASVRAFRRSCRATR